jgi:hypothetical protein
MSWDMSSVNEVFWATFWATAINFHWHHQVYLQSSITRIPFSVTNVTRCVKLLIYLMLVKPDAFLEIRFRVSYAILTTAMFQYKQAFTRGIFHDGFVMHKSVWISSRECNLTASYLYLNVNCHLLYLVTTGLGYPHESNELIHTRLGNLWITLHDWNLFIHKKHY